MTTYYISNTGSDSNDGLTTETSFATIAKINTITLTAGDQVLFKNGDTWRNESLSINQSGVNGNPIIVSNYGVGNNPTFYGSLQASGWVDQGGNIWKSSTTLADPMLSNDGNVFFENLNSTISTGVLKTAGTMVTEYDWYWATNNIYVYATSDPTSRYTAIEVAQINLGVIKLNKKDYITVDGIDILYAKSSGIHGGQSDPTLVQYGITVRNCEIAYLGYPDGDGYGISLIANDSLVENCIIHDHGRRAVSIYLYANFTVSNITIQDNTFYNGYHTQGVDCGIVGGRTGSIVNLLVQRNTIGNDKSYSPVKTPMGNHIANDGSSNQLVVKFHYNIIKGSFTGINTRGSTNFEIYNNTFFEHNEAKGNGNQFIYMTTGAGGLKCNVISKNNIFYSTLPSTNTGTGYTYWFSDGHTLQSDYNCFYRVNSTLTLFYKYGVGGYSYSWDDIDEIRALGWEEHSVFTDPVFVSSFDVSLQPSSSLINSGIDIGLTSDYAENPIIGMPDIGAYEYVSPEPKYYISSTGNDSNDGLTPETAWQTLAKVNAKVKTAGDQYLFAKSDTFYGNLTIGQSGTDGLPIIFGSYGTGDNPIITGFTDVTEWTDLGGNIWESTSAVSALATCNMVSINGINTPMGREPNTGYYYQQSYTTSSLTSSSLTGTTNWTGAELAYDIYPWQVGRATITSQSGSTVNFTANVADDEIYTTGMRFIIQNDARTLDVQNEWYFNPSTKKLQIYSTSEPTNVQVASVNILASLVGKNFVTFSGIDFTGTEQAAFYLSNAKDIIIENCAIKYSANAAIYGIYNTTSNRFTIQNCTIDECNNGGIGISSDFPDAIIRSNTVKNIGMVYGSVSYAIGSGNASGQGYGISSIANGTLIEKNTIENIGYVGIRLRGNNSTAQNNFINEFCKLLSDGGGIYTYNGSGTTYSGTKIKNNIVLNGSLGHGIYLDDKTNGIEVSENTVSSCNLGIYLHNNYNSIIRKNLCYDNNIGLEIYNSDISVTMSGNVINSNQFIAKDASDKCFFADQMQRVQPILLADSNYYARPIDDNLVFTYYTWTPSFASFNNNLEQWQSYTGQDLNSKKSPKSISNVNELYFVYNETSLPKEVSIPTMAIDMDGVQYSTIFMLDPYSSVVLIKDTSTENPTNKNKGFKSIGGGYYMHPISGKFYVK